MKKILVLFTVFMLIGLVQAFAQRHPHHRAHRRADRVTVVKRTHVHPRYPRTRVVVVRSRRVRTVAVMPAGHVTYVVRGRNYYYANGFYHAHVNNVYTVVAPPVGVRIRILPVGYRRIVIAGAPHFYYQGAYYRQVGEEYETVEPTIGTLVPELPEDNVDEVTIDGETYYEFDDRLYKAKVTTEGTQYEMVGKLDD